jgi:K+-transporting ATPase ATPase A chain
MWFLPLSIIVFTIIIAFPLSKYMAGIMEGKHHAPRIFRWVEKQLDSGEHDWKQYTVALLAFNTALFVYGYLILSIQPWMPLNPQHKGLLSPTTIFNSAVSFMTNTNLQHYSGDQHLSNFSQIFFCIPNFFLSAAVGLCGLTAIIRLFRGQKKIGNFFVDMWRVVVYIFLPVAFLLSLVFVQQGMPMTYRSFCQVSTLELRRWGQRTAAKRNSGRSWSVHWQPLCRRRC